MTISSDGRLTPPDAPDPCHVCGEPVGNGHEYRDVHDGCREASDD